MAKWHFQQPLLQLFQKYLLILYMTGHCFFFQIIMVRLQRVTFLALHNYLGLTTELFNPVRCLTINHALRLENILHYYSIYYSTYDEQSITVTSCRKVKLFHLCQWLVLQERPVQAKDYADTHRQLRKCLTKSHRGPWTITVTQVRYTEERV